MADFRQQAPTPEPVRRDLSGARNFEASAGVAGAIMGAIPGLAQSMNERADRKFDNKIALALTDSAITGIGRDRDSEEINVSAAKLVQRNGQRSPHNESRLRATVEARRLAEKYPHRAAEVFQKFGLMTGQPILAAAREIEEEALRPIKEQEAQLDQWSLAEGVPLEWDRGLRNELFMGSRDRVFAQNRARDDAAHLQNQGLLDNHMARRLLRQEAPGLYEEMSALVNQVMTDVDPFATSPQDKAQLMQGYQEVIDDKIREVIEAYDGHMTEAEAREILAPTLRLFDQAQRWVNGEISTEALENENLFLRVAHDNKWLNTPGFQDLQTMAALLGALPGEFATPTVKAQQGRQFFNLYRDVIESVRMSQSGNPVEAAREEGRSDKELGELAEHGMQYVVSVLTNPDTDPDEAAAAAELVLSSWTDAITQDPHSVPTSVYDAILFALANSEVGARLNDAGVFGENAQGFNNYRRMMNRYMRDITEDVASQVQRLGNAPTAMTVVSEGMSLPFGGVSAVGRGIREMTRGTLDFEVKPNGNVVATPTDPKSSRMSAAAENFNEKYSDRIGMVARAQSLLFGQDGAEHFQQATNRFLDGHAIDAPDRETLNSDAMNIAIQSLVDQGFTEDQIQAAVQAMRNNL